MTIAEKVAKIPTDGLKEAAEAAWLKFKAGKKSFKIKVPCVGSVHVFIEDYNDPDFNGFFCIATREVLLLRPKMRTKKQFLKTTIHEFRHAQQFPVIGYRSFKRLIALYHKPGLYYECPLEIDAYWAVKVCLGNV